MEMKYVDGREGDDKLFDLSLDDQRIYVARAMDCDPGHSLGWPIRIIDKLIELRRAQGKDAFYGELGRMMSADVT